MKFTEKLFGTHSERELKRIYPIVDKIEALRPTMQALTDEELRAKTKEYKDRYNGGESLDSILPEAFATVREAAKRSLGMEHHRVQLIGGIILHQGRIAEMKTGEGKTLVSTLPAYLNALTGRGVHIVTVNDYLANRDAEWMGKVHRFLGLTVGVVLNDMKNDERRQQYACDITYITNNELGFDYLRDNMVIYKEQLVQRELAYCIIDEVDSVLIDEARTPLIISGQSSKSTKLYETADILAHQMQRGEASGEMTKMTAIMGEEIEETGDFIVNEKDKFVTLTDDGVKKVENFFHIENLSDPENLEIQHNVILALRANYLMHRDKDYVVKDDEVLIVDEFTGRIMPGRRYSDGLHQAIEAKEHVKVRRESKTLATITFQNFFNKYEKKAGMTGTALTEEQEFRDIYGMDVIEIPTNRPVIRVDMDDAVYMTKKEKFHAVVEEVKEAHAVNQPVLVGTITIETSELISKMLRREGIPHQVLNAKFHELEAEIVAHAGEAGAVTIATNMAGRGTDIMLGGNVSYMAKAALRKELSRDLTKDLAQLKDEYEHAKARAKAAGTELPTPPEETIDAQLEHLMTECDGHAETEDAAVLHARQRFEELCEEFEPEIKREAAAVREAGGLFIIGTERHESRRIDNQLRGRAGRQGDPGASRFFLSLEDDLMRIFGGERVQNLMDSLGLEEDVPIENKLITNTIESAQKKLEASNFAIRKQVLQYDDVMNQQREIIYKQRQMVLDGEDISDKLHEMMRQSIDDACTNYLNGETADDWDFAGLRRHFMNWLCLPSDFNYTKDQLADLTKEGIADELYKRGMDILTAKEKKYGSKTMRELERICLLRNVDSKWMDHIDNMDQLKQGMGLRGYGQHDPVVEYRIEGFAMFDEMIASIREDAVHMLLTIEIRQQNAEPKREQIAKPTGEGAPTQAGTKGAAPVRVTKIGRNDPCPCGSGLKWKKCTCKEYHPDL